MRDWEPRLATVADGQTEALVRAAAGALAPGGALVLEVHEGRAAEVRGAARAAGYVGGHDGRDLAGRDRVVEGRWQRT